MLFLVVLKSPLLVPVPGARPRSRGAVVRAWHGAWRNGLREELVGEGEAGLQVVARWVPPLVGVVVVEAVVGEVVGPLVLGPRSM